MKNFFKKYGFTLIFGLFSLVVICVVITINFESLRGTLTYQMDRNHTDVTAYKSYNKIISAGDNNLSTKPVSAKVEDGYLKIESELINNTGKNLKIRDFAILTFGGYEFASNVKFDGDGTLNNGSTIVVTYEANISALKNVNVIPTTARVELGSYDLYNNYNEFNLKYVISWY